MGQSVRVTTLVIRHLIRGIWCLTIQRPNAVSIHRYPSKGSEIHESRKSVQRSTFMVHIYGELDNKHPGTRRDVDNTDDFNMALRETLRPYSPPGSASVFAMHC